MMECKSVNWCRAWSEYKGRGKSCFKKKIIVKKQIGVKMLYVGKTSVHTKQRGKIRRCDWCGQVIDIGEQYVKILCFDCGRRQTVYAHKECNDEWWSFLWLRAGLKSTEQKHRYSGACKNEDKL